MRTPARAALVLLELLGEDAELVFVALPTFESLPGLPDDGDDDDDDDDEGETGDEPEPGPDTEEEEEEGNEPELLETTVPVEEGDTL